MKLQIFNIKEEKAINGFLAKQKDNIVERIAFGAAEKIGFFFEDEVIDEEKQIMKVKIGSLKKALLEKELEWLAKDVVVRFWTGQNIKNGDKQSMGMIMQAKADREQTESHIHYTKQLLNELENVGKTQNE